MRDQQRMWELAGKYSARGIELVIALVLPTLVGVYLDRRLGTTPWLLLAGLVVGIGAGSRAIMHVVKLARRDDERPPDVRGRSPRR